MPVPLHAAADDRAVECVEGGKASGSRDDAVADRIKARSEAPRGRAGTPGVEPVPEMCWTRMIPCLSTSVVEQIVVHMPVAAARHRHAVAPRHVADRCRLPGEEAPALRLAP